MVESDALKEWQLAQLALINKHDPYTATHSLSVANLVGDFSLHLGLAPENAQRNALAAALHDLGKLDVPAGLITSTAKLSDEDYAIMNGHSNAGAKRLRACPDKAFAEFAAPAALHHHSPHEIEGRPVPFIARLTAVADVWDALRSARSYKRIWTPSEAACEIALAPKLDPILSGLFLGMMAQEHPEQFNTTALDTCRTADQRATYQLDLLTATTRLQLDHPRIATDGDDTPNSAFQTARRLSDDQLLSHRLGLPPHASPASLRPAGAPTKTSPSRRLKLMADVQI